MTSNDKSSTADGIETLLSRHFGFQEFNPGQREPIETVLGGEDAVVVMPTGSGKSLCYQLAAMAMDGVALVVSPLISLMKDQVDGLAVRGIPAASLNSSLTSDETFSRISELRNGRTKLLYVAPERFRNKSFQNLLADLNVTLIAIDEAHCISQWGHDFRPDYMRLGAVLEGLPGARVMALTATATPEVQADIVRQLGLGTKGRSMPRVFVRGFRRDNLRLVMSNTPTHGDKLNRIARVLADFPTGIVYCSTRKQVERVGQMLKEEKVKHLIYHAGLNEEQRRRSQELFMGGEFPVMVATNAFGMGVDRADLRFVVHWDVPGSVEAYYQEVGRAGRDGALAHCELLYNYADVRTQEFFLDGSNPDPATVMNVWQEVRAILSEGPKTCPLDEWGELILATDNKIALHTCMGIYDRCGLVNREITSGRRCYTTSLVAGADQQRLRDLLPTLEEKRKRDMLKLERMLKYVNARSCRHQFILGYFGEKSAMGAACGHCDYCGFTKAVLSRAPTEEEWVIVQKLLSCVWRLDNRFGRNTILAVVTGANSEYITARKLQESPTYGVLAGAGLDYLRKLFDELVRAGAIAAAADQYAVVSLTPLGREVAWRRATVELHWPVQAMKAPAEVSRAPAAFRRSVEKRSSNVSPRPAVSVLTTEEGAVFDALKKWRQTQAVLQKVPAYRVFSNSTLQAIAVARPRTHQALTSISGIGPVKLAAYGEAVLNVISHSIQ